MNCLERERRPVQIVCEETKMKAFSGIFICLFLTSAAWGQAVDSAGVIESGWQCPSSRPLFFRPMRFSTPTERPWLAAGNEPSGFPSTAAVAVDELGVCHWQPSNSPKKVFSGSSFSIGQEQNFSTYPTVGQPWMTGSGVAESVVDQESTRTVPGWRYRPVFPRFRSPEPRGIRLGRVW